MTREEMEDYLLQYSNENVWILSQSELEYEMEYIHNCAILNQPCWE